MAEDRPTRVEDWEIEPGHIRCLECHGDRPPICNDCDGTGRVIEQCDRGYDHEEECGNCDGKGWVECQDCDGIGQVLDPDVETDRGL